MEFLERIRGSANSLRGSLRGPEKEKDKVGEYMPITISSVSSLNSVSSPELGNLVYVVYFLLGTGSLLPWNAFISAVDYFEYLYPNSHIDRVFTGAYLSPCFVMLVILILWGQKFSIKSRINAGLVIFFFCIIVVPFMEIAFIDGKRGTTWTHSVTISAVAVAGIADAIVQGTIVGSAGELPDRYMQAVVSGTGFSGVLVSLLRIVTKASVPQTERGLRISANIYFSVSGFVMIICIASYNLVHKLTIPIQSPVDEVGKPASTGKLAPFSLSTGASADMDVENHRGFEGADTNGVPNWPVLNAVMDSSSTLDGENDAWFEAKRTVDTLGNRSLPASVDSSSVVSQEREWYKKGGDLVIRESGFKPVLIQLKWVAGAICLIYVITLSIFPGFLTEDVQSAVMGDWYPVLLIAVYNVFDLVGKSSSSLYVPSHELLCVAGSVARVLLIPLFASCVHGPRVLRTEAPMFFLTALLGVTNGYFTVCLFLFAPKLVHPADAQTAGVVMVTALEVGLTIGSLVAWVWVV